MTNPRLTMRRLAATIKHRIRRHLHAEQMIVAPAQADAFSEALYLKANPDVAAAVMKGQFSSGLEHYELFGKTEGRNWVMGEIKKSTQPLMTAKRKKLEKIRHILRDDMASKKTPGYYDFLTDELRQEFNIADTDAVSSNGYDDHVLSLIERHRDGWVLDCGAGKRTTYYENVVNFEIVAYDSTDVRGVGEKLPFKDAVFDAVISIAVLEHVKDPFRCAAEIARVLKPGGELICAVPFLQPYHGYPHHYYNMTHQGLANLFAPYLTVDRIDVYQSVLPIWSLTWIVKSWADGLRGQTKDDFLNMRLCDLLAPPPEYLAAPFVTELPHSKNLELASACVLFGTRTQSAAASSAQAH